MPGRLRTADDSGSRGYIGRNFTGFGNVKIEAYVEFSHKSEESELYDCKKDFLATERFSLSLTEFSLPKSE
jgi:hypothetical protein